MKLPEEIEVEVAKYGIPLVCVESIVRDCAKVCADAQSTWLDPTIHVDCANAILSRYGLEPK